MALKPILKLKVDELFLRWLSEPETQHLLKTNLKQILRGEPVTSYKPPWPQSPRARPMSPSTPPCSPATTSKVMSPRSPRRSTHSRSVVKQLNNNNFKAPKDEHAAPAVENSHQRGEPDGEAISFLRQKEAQLREKRERERQQKEQLEKQKKEEEKEKEKQVDREKEKSKDIIKIDTKEKEKNRHEKDSSKLNKSIENKAKKKEKEKEKEPAVVAPPLRTKEDPVSPKSDASASPKSDTSSHSSKSEKPKVKKEQSPPSKEPALKVPQFYFPMGKPPAVDESDVILQRLKDAFGKIEGGKATKVHMPAITKACGLPLYWKCPLFLAAGGEKSGHITLQQFLALWKKISSTCHDRASKFIRLISKAGSNSLQFEEFLPFIQDVVDTHPGLLFLQDAPEFHSRYVNTVISRIFYCVNRSWSGRITIPELRKSNFLQTIQLLEEEDDINQIVDFFSYEHFYVIYCKFWELDKDHDLYISKEDLARHNDHAISSRMIDRIFSGCVTRSASQKEGKMSYKDFVWFLISEEDKQHLTSIEYWFRCMDLDGDGVISMYEMEYFYEEMVQRMESMGIETLPFEDCLCQMLDMVKPKTEGQITLWDLKNCKMTPLFFDTFFNLEKYLEHEQKDPFANVRDPDEPEMSDWERYAAEEYEILVAEEGANDAQMDEIAYEDDFEPEEEEAPEVKAKVAATDNAVQKRKGQGQGRTGTTSPEDDIYDFSSQDLGY